MNENNSANAPAVSIIVPVYNAEATLRRCIDSVQKQAFRDFELLLMDDGSRDASPQICDEYAAGDPRIRVIHKANSGVSTTRNMAIDLARGRYLQFLDSDDWLSPEATALLVGMAEENKCDMVVSDFYRVVEDRLSHKGDIPEDGLITREEYAEYMLGKPADFYYGVLWNKLFRRDLIEAHHLRMDADISWCEDFMFNLDYIRYTHQIYVLRVPIYYYVKTKNSLSAAGTSLAKTVQMKRLVFAKYDRFYREVFPEEDSSTSHLQVYRFLIDAASDGLVPPAVLPGTHRLGEERIQVNPTALEGEGILADLYRDKKSLETYLVSVAFRNDLTTDEVYLLYCLGQFRTPCTRKELAEYSTLPLRRLNTLMQRLQRNGYLQIVPVRTAKEKKSEKKTSSEASAKEPGRSEPNRIEIILLPPARDLILRLEEVEEQYYTDRFTGFTLEEIDQYQALSARIRSNMNRVLSR